MTLKYKEVQVTFSEVPDEISLCINITGCPIRCNGCHSKHLWEDIGDPLTPETLDALIRQNSGITCVCFMGGDIAQSEVAKLSEWVHENTNLKTAWYSGRKLSDVKFQDTFDYLKVGPYVKELGDLRSRETNQRFYRVLKKPYKCVNLFYCTLEDITFKFQN